MTERRKLPDFATEAEEAQWWFDNREQIGEEFAQAIRDGRATQGTLARRIAAVHLDPEDEQKARKIAQSKGIEYHTYVKALLHEALLREQPAT